MRRRRRPFYQREVRWTWLLERELPALAPDDESRYVIYTLDVEAEIDPPGGDGWNEPRYSASASCAATVVSVYVEQGTRTVDLDLGFIGPMEPGVHAPGTTPELKEREYEVMKERALDLAYCDGYPDPDEEYDSRIDRE